MDVLAALFHQLEAAAIPVIFRPYHEMNGDWFWWGRRPGPEGYTLLWRQLYHYYTEVHGLNNLLWAWCTDRPWEGIEAYYPGAGCVDIVGADIYPKTGYADVYRQEWHDRLRALAEGKPVALTENSLIPDEATLETQPWAWFMCWGGLTFRAHSGAELKACYDSPRVASLEDRSKL
jgi:mannan endo-1,4-beta-mannosidase